MKEILSFIFALLYYIPHLLFTCLLWLIIEEGEEG